MCVGFAIEHELIAVFISEGAMREPRYFGRDWWAGSGWFGAVLYSAIGLRLGYLGWRSAQPPASAGSPAGSND